MSIAIKLTLPEQLAKQTKANVKQFGYSNVQELTLEAIRELNKRLEIEAFHSKHFQKYDGRRPSRQERAAAVDELLELKKLR